jgi:hypothetical protein
MENQETRRFKIFKAHEHRKNSNRFEVWDTKLQQCKGQYIGKESAQIEADRLEDNPESNKYAPNFLTLYGSRVPPDKYSRIKSMTDILVGESDHREHIDAARRRCILIAIEALKLAAT